MFKIGEIYRRRELHDNYGGNRQGGISNCANHPMIFIFTGKSGKLHGYEDGWDDHNYLTAFVKKS
jgi:5-methylcytosine-specific restriction enzyme A